MNLFTELTPAGLLRRRRALGDPEGVWPKPSLDPEHVRRRGWAEAAGLAPRAELLADVLDDLHADGLPLTAIYVLDEAWAVGRDLRDAVSQALGAPYALVEDFWAFRIMPGQRGWSPHRGVEVPLDRERPEYLNTWVALSDVPVERSCMWFVPLEDDPAYQKGDLTVLHRELPTGVAAPIARGTGLVWNANVLHWGGPCSPSEAEPRRSLTFTLVRADALGRADLGAAVLVDPENPDPWWRLEQVARQIVTYGDREPDLSDAARDWARTTLTMKALLRRG